MTPVNINGINEIDLNLIGTVTATVSAGKTSISQVLSGAANLVFATPNGSSGNAALRALVPGDITGLGTMALQNANAVAITGGTINGTTIGTTTPSTGAFTSLSVSGTETVNTINPFSGTLVSVGANIQMTGAAPNILGGQNTGTATFLQADPPSGGNGGSVKLWGSGRTDGSKSQVQFDVDGTLAMIIDGSAAGHNARFVGIGNTSVSTVVPAVLSVGSSYQFQVNASGSLTTSGSIAAASAILTAPLPVSSGGTGVATAATNLVFSSPNGSTGAPSFRALAAADLPLATTSAFGAVKPDGTTVTISAGVISASGGTTPTGAANLVYATPNGSSGSATLRTLVPADLPVATTSALGAVKPDGTTITISGGVISAAGSGSYTLGGTLSNSNIVSANASVSGTLTATGLDGIHQISFQVTSAIAAPASLVTVTFTTSRGHTTYPVLSNAQSGPTSIASFFSTGGSTSYLLRAAASIPAGTYTLNVSCP